MTTTSDWAARLRFVPMTPATARRIADAWHYPAPHDFYDITADADDLEEFVTQALWPPVFLQVLDDEDETGDPVVAFLTAEPDAGRAEISLGLRPDLTGAGRGEAFLRTALTHLGARLPGVDTWTLGVAAFNRRAIKVYERCDFHRTREYDQRTNGGVHRFVAMERAAARA